ncbi:MAG: hypothetical protein IPG25_02600 [Proteobacteria bacterium]|nr:hypothetical protein [Pseudomonadota bacterium]
MRVLLRTALSIVAVLAASAVIPVASAADAVRPPTVLVIGATGETGLETMAAAQAAGLQTRGLTRDRALAVATHPGLDWFEVDVRDPRAWQMPCGTCVCDRHDWRAGRHGS